MKVLVDTDVLLYISCWNKNDLVQAIDHWEDLVGNIANEIAHQCTYEEPPVIEMMFPSHDRVLFNMIIKSIEIFVFLRCLTATCLFIIWCN